MNTHLHLISRQLIHLQRMPDDSHNSFPKCSRRLRRYVPVMINWLLFLMTPMGSVQIKLLSVNCFGVLLVILPRKSYINNCYGVLYPLLIIKKG